MWVVDVGADDGVWGDVGVVEELGDGVCVEASVDVDGDVLRRCAGGEDRATAVVPWGEVDDSGDLGGGGYGLA